MNAGEPTAARRGMATIFAALATTATLLVLDLTWLDVVARSVYDSALASLKRPVVFTPAAGLFYLLYIAAIVRHAILGSGGPGTSARRGAELGLIVYGTYELTNWAVLRDWPVVLVPLDIAWGVTLTAAASVVGRLAYGSQRTGSRR